MQISQSALFQLFFASFLAGILLALFYDVLYALRICLMPPSVRYTVLAIQSRYTTHIQKTGQKKGKLLSIVLFLSDVLFCLVGAITLILLLYWLNNGAFRVATPLLMAVGFWGWHVCFSSAIRTAFQWLVFGFETLLHILVKPIKYLVLQIANIITKKLKKRHFIHLAKKRYIYTKQTLKNVDKDIQKILQHLQK